MQPPSLGPRDFDEILADLLEDEPDERLDDVIVAAEQRPRVGARRWRPGDVRLVVYREPALLEARDRDELRELARRQLRAAFGRARAHAAR